MRLLSRWSALSPAARQGLLTALADVAGVALLVVGLAAVWWPLACLVPGALILAARLYGACRR